MPRFARAGGSDTDRQVAQSLFDDGRARMDAGYYVEACPKFAEGHRLAPAGGAIRNLARCQELEGRTEMDELIAYVQVMGTSLKKAQ